MQITEQMKKDGAYKLDVMLKGIASRPGNTNCYMPEDALEIIAGMIIEQAFAKASQSQGTPSSRWAAEGQPDPHDNIYNCERADLTMGDLTDDELANAAFLNYDRWPRIEDIIAGKAHPPIAYMTAVKERIRWLSRKLAEATKTAR